MEKWRNGPPVVQDSSPLWGHPAMLVLILALCGLALYWWFGDREETGIEDAKEAPEQPSVVGERGKDARRMEHETPSQVSSKEQATTQDRFPQGPVVGKRETKPEADAAVRAPDTKGDVVEPGIPEETVAMDDMWQSFREQRLPRFAGQLQQILGVEHPIDIDWNSLGHEQHAPESMEYDLEMLVRALGMNEPYQDPRNNLDAEQLRQGIKRVHIRGVDRMELRRFEVEGDTLQIAFFRGRFGSFSPNEIRALLADRDRAQLSMWLNSPEAPLGPLLEEVRRNRIPPLYRKLETAMGQPIPWHIDWPSLNLAPDYAERLVYMLDGLIQAIGNILNTDTGFGMRRSELERQRAEESRAILLGNLKGLRVRGGSWSNDPVVRFHEGATELVVFQDERLGQAGKSGQDRARVDTDIRRYPPCRREALEKTIVDTLDLEVGPYLRQAKEVYLPQAQAYVKEFFDSLIAKTRYRELERVELRELLASRELVLEVDWDSLTSPLDSADKMQILRQLETGKYNYNSNYGELFRDLFPAIEEATRLDRDFLKRFLSVVQSIRYEQVSDPEAKELVVEGSTLLLRQCLNRPHGVISYQDLAKKLAIAVTAMTERSGRTQPRGGTELDGCLAEFRQAVGVAVTVDDSVATTPEVARQACRRVVLPLNGALQYLNRQPGYAALIRERLRSVRIGHSAASEAPAFSFLDGALLLSCSPEQGARGCLSADEMVRVIDDLLVLRVRVEIAGIERENQDFWHRMLRERFDREVDIEVDWESFLSHPAAGGNHLSPLNVQQAGIERLIYALTGWMDDDQGFRAEAIRRINGLGIASAEDAAAKGVELQGDRLVYRCFAGDWEGYYSIDELQQHLNRLLPRNSNTPKEIKKDWVGWLRDHGIRAVDVTETEQSPIAEEPSENGPSRAPDDEPVLPEASIPVVDTRSGGELSAIGGEAVDEVLRAELESVYDAFIEAVRARDLDGLLRVVKVSKTDQETLQREYAADGQVGLADWMLGAYPERSQTTFVTLKGVDDGYAGYYFLWAPSYSDAYLNLSLRRFEKIAGQWKLIYSLGETGDAPLPLSTGEELRAEVMQALATNPLLRLERPERQAVSDGPPKAAELTAAEIQLKAELEGVFEELRGALERKDVEGFLAAVRLSLEDEQQLRKRFRGLREQILTGTPSPAQTDFVTLKFAGKNLVGYYYLAPYPHNPAFTFVYLRPFVKHQGRWKMLFSLDHDLAMNLSVAKSDGDAISRAMEVIDKIDLLQLRWVVELFRKFIPQDSEEPVSSVAGDEMARAAKALAQKNYSEAVSLLEKLADSGVPEARSRLGLLYAEGNGVGRDYSASIRLFRSAAARGDADGLYYLGYSYLYGTGVEADLVQALSYFILAADRGHLVAARERDKGLAALDERQRAEAFELAKTFSIYAR